MNIHSQLSNNNFKKKCFRKYQDSLCQLIINTQRWTCYKGYSQTSGGSQAGSLLKFGGRRVMMYLFQFGGRGFWGISIWAGGNQLVSISISRGSDIIWIGRGGEEMNTHFYHVDQSFCQQHSIYDIFTTCALSKYPFQWSYMQWYIYVLNKYIDIKSICLLCFYAFIVQKSFTTMNFCWPDGPGISHICCWQLLSSTLNGFTFFKYWTKFDTKMTKNKMKLHGE